MPLASTAYFVKTTAKLTYIPRKHFTKITGPMGGVVATDFASQEYDLTGFLSALAAPGLWQQCNDNSNLLAILAGSLGISATPLWFANKWRPAGPADLLAPTSYFGAGEMTITRPGVRFSFHQIVAYRGLVYDACASSVAGGPPTMSRTFASYISFAFPTQGSLGTGTPITQSVTTITVK